MTDYKRVELPAYITMNGRRYLLYAVEFNLGLGAPVWLLCYFVGGTLFVADPCCQDVEVFAEWPCGIC